MKFRCALENSCARSHAVHEKLGSFPLSLLVLVLAETNVPVTDSRCKLAVRGDVPGENFVGVMRISEV